MKADRASGLIFSPPKLSTPGDSLVFSSGVRDDNPARNLNVFNYFLPNRRDMVYTLAYLEPIALALKGKKERSYRMDEDRHCWCCRSAGRELRSIIHSGPCFFLFYYYYLTGFLDSIHCWLMSATPFRHTTLTHDTQETASCFHYGHTRWRKFQKKTTSTAKRQSRSATPRLLYIFLTDGLDPITSTHHQ